MGIRLASKRDTGEIGRLYSVLFADMAALKPEYVNAGRMDETYIRNTISGVNSDVFVAEEEGRIVGFALLQERETPPYDSVVPHRYAFLMDLVVDPGIRGAGIGTALIEACKSWARERRLDYVELNVLSNNYGAQKLYDRLGFEPFSQLLRCRL